MESSCNISCAIQILSSWINKMNHIISDVWIISFSWWIMNHCSIGATWTDCIKTKTFVVLKFVSSRVNVFSSLELVDFLLFGSPCPEFYLSNCITNMTVSESVNLFVCSHSSVKANTLPFNGLFQKWKEIMIQWTLFYQCFVRKFRIVLS